MCIRDSPRVLFVFEKSAHPLSLLNTDVRIPCALTIIIVFSEKNAFSLWRRAHPCAGTIFFANPVFANHSPATMKPNFFLLIWRPGAPQGQMPQMRDNKSRYGANMEPTWCQHAAQMEPQTPGNTGSGQNCLHFSICACHPCAGAMLIFSVSFQF